MPLFLGQNKQNREMANSVGLSSLLRMARFCFVLFFAYNTIGRKKKDCFLLNGVVCIYISGS